MDAVLDTLRQLAGPLGLGGIILYYLRDRRKTRLSDELAEKTIGPAVQEKSADAFQAQIVAIERAFAVERESKDRQIRGLEREVREVEARCQRKVAALQRENDDLQRLLTEALQRIDRLEANIKGNR